MAADRVFGAEAAAGPLSAEQAGPDSAIATAGIGTTANTLVGAMMLLSRHPEQRALLRDDE